MPETGSIEADTWPSWALCRYERRRERKSEDGGGKGLLRKQGGPFHHCITPRGCGVWEGRTNASDRPRHRSSLSRELIPICRLSDASDALALAPLLPARRSPGPRLPAKLRPRGSNASHFRLAMACGGGISIGSWSCCMELWIHPYNTSCRCEAKLASKTCVCDQLGGLH